MGTFVDLGDISAVTGLYFVPVERKVVDKKEDLVHW